MSWRWSIERCPAYLSLFLSALNISLFPPTFSCAFSTVFLWTVFTVERFTGQASLAPISCGGLEIRVQGLCRGLMWQIERVLLSDEGGCPCRAEVRGWLRGRWIGLPLSPSRDTSPPPTFHLLTLQVNTSGKLSFKRLEGIILKMLPPSLSQETSFHSPLPPTHSKRVKPELK